MIQPNWAPKKKQLRQFAVISLFGFGLIGFMLKWKFGLETAPLVVWGIGVVTFVSGLIAPITVFPIYTILMVITLPIGWVVSNLFLRILFYGIMTPFGFVLKATGRDPLKMKRPDTGTYWDDRSQRKDLSSYYRQA
jgi:polyferredoxin